MVSETWAEKMKKKDNLPFLQKDEFVVFLAGIDVYFLFPTFLFFFVCAVLIWYWFKIRNYEQLIVQKKRDIYNIQYDNVEGQTKDFAEGRTAEARRPMEYELDQLETRRKFLVDKLVVVSLVSSALLGLQAGTQGSVPAIL